MNFTSIAYAGARASATPAAILGVPIFCAVWFTIGLSVDLLTNILSILAITMSSLVLLAGRRESLALHTKLDELIEVTEGARNELEHAEELAEEEIVRLRDRNIAENGKAG